MVWPLLAGAAELGVVGLEAGMLNMGRVAVVREGGQLAARTVTKVLAKMSSNKDRLGAVSKRLGRDFSSLDELKGYIKNNPAMSGLVALELYDLGSELYSLMADDPVMARVVETAMNIRSPDPISALETDRGSLDDELIAIQAACRRFGDDAFLQLRKAISCSDEVVAHYFTERDRARHVFR